MSTVLDRDPLLRAGHHPLKGLAGRAPQRLRDLKPPSVKDVRGDLIGCEEAARELGIGRTQMWRLADQGKIDCLRCGTLAEDLETTVQSVGDGYVILDYKIAKRWQPDSGTREVRINGQAYPVHGVTWDPPRARQGVKTKTRLWLAGDTSGLAPGQTIFVPEGKWGRPEYKFRRADVLAYAELRQSARFVRQVQNTTRALYDLLDLTGGLLVPTLQGVVRKPQREPAPRRTKLIHPLAGLPQ